MVIYVSMVKETLNKSQYFLSRHAGESQHPVSNSFDWILAFARMTVKILVQRFPKDMGNYEQIVRPCIRIICAFALIGCGMVARAAEWQVGPGESITEAV